MTNVHKRAKTADKIATSVLYVTACLFLLLLAGITIYIFYKGAAAFSPTMLSFERSGIAVEFFNTIYLVILSLVFSVPIGIAAGIYMAEYAREGRFTHFLRICIETLSSLPSIVVGLFGYLFFIVMTGSKWNLLAGALTVSILNLPLITSTTEDAIRSVPNSYREGGFGIGATHWQTIVTVIVPSALPRIITGVILAAGRSFGEAAALIYTAGLNSDININNWNPASRTSLLNPLRPADTLAVHIWALKTEGVEKNAGQIADFSAAVLIAMVFLFSLGARFVSNILEKKLTGKGGR
ncbi:MAG TPA: phosphate ABC transporter permease PstA [Ruminiclostridium sp.]|nr:phosphate ABC transporter permease PstA [Ruminiclostridium sp.]